MAHRLIERTGAGDIEWRSYNPNKRAYSALCNDTYIGVSHPGIGRYYLWARVSNGSEAVWGQVPARRRDARRLWKLVHEQSDEVAAQVAAAMRDVAM